MKEELIEKINKIEDEELIKFLSKFIDGIKKNVE